MATNTFLDDENVSYEYREISEEIAGSENVSPLSEGRLYFLGEIFVINRFS